MKVLITGRNGQVGWELQRTVPREWQIIALRSENLDIIDREKVLETVAQYAPSLIINAAAYTAVDKAELDREKAFAVNGDGAGNLAEAAKLNNARFIHISTDFVFDGGKSSPYLPGDKPNPLGVYGASKLKGEEKIFAHLNGEGILFRTAWVYSAHGANFVKTMLRLMRERDSLRVIADQAGTPTWAHSFAEVIWQVAARPELKGIYHWSDAGIASWYDFAVAIQEEAFQLGLLEKKIPIEPVPTSEYPTPAQRPPYSVLDKTATWKTLGCSGVHWRVNLRAMLKEVRSYV